MKQVEIELCAGTACHLMGSHQLVAALENLPCAQRQLIQLRLLNCLEACGQGPNVRINGVLHSQVSVDRLQAIITESLTSEK